MTPQPGKEEKDNLKDKLQSAIDGYLADPACFEIDLDELLELIDYANSSSSWSYSWLLVMLGQRLYPNEDLVKSRVSYLLYQEGEKDLSLKMLESCDDSLPWTTSLKMLVRNEDNPQALKQELCKIVDTARRIDSNAALNIVTAARMIGDVAFIRSIQKTIAKKCESPEDFLLDLLDWAKTTNNNEWVKEILDSLEQIAPFNPDFWEEKAAFEADIEDNLDEALSDVEYSLAIEPDSEPGMVVKARLLWKVAFKSDDADDAKTYVDYLNKALALYPDSFDLVALLYDQLSSPWIFNLTYNDATPLLRYVNNNPGEKRAVEMMARIAEVARDFNLQAIILRRYYEASKLNVEQDYFEWAQVCRANGFTNLAKSILETFYQLSRRDADSAEVLSAYLEMLYLRKAYEAIVDIASRRMVGGENDGPAATTNGDPRQYFNTFDLYLIALSAARLGLMHIVEGILTIVEAAMAAPGGVIEKFGVSVVGSAERLIARQVIDFCRSMVDANERQALTESVINAHDIYLRDFSTE